MPKKTIVLKYANYSSIPSDILSKSISVEKDVCENCNGTEYSVPIRISNGIYNIYECPMCKGVGRIYYVELEGSSLDE